MPNKAIVRKVNELMICCTNHREGCGWEGELGELKSHLDSDKGCGYVEVTCTNKGCGERVSRKDLQTHLQEKCYYRPYVCEHCGHKDIFKVITGESNLSYLGPGGHYLECSEYPLACPNRCGVTGIRRRAMPDHHSSCPLEPLDCPFKDAGCTEKIARKDMEDHMTTNQQKHILQGYLSMQRQRERDQRRLHLLKDDMRREIDSLEESIQHNANTPESIAQSLCRMKSILTGSLDEIGDALTFRMRDFNQLRKEKKAWHSPPFSIGDKVRVQLAVYPSGVGRGRGSHVSVSLILREVVEKEEDMYLEYNVSVTAIGRSTSAIPKTFELCSLREGDTHDPQLQFLANKLRLQLHCSAHFNLSSPGEVLQSEEVFLEIEEAKSLLANDAMTLELKLLEHHHHSR